MIDYIKREDAKNMMRKFRGYYDEDAIAKFEIALGAGYIPPNEDVVEVVRCKDCKYAEVADPEDSQDGYICQFHRGCIWFSGSYCSWAERKES